MWEHWYGLILQLLNMQQQQLGSKLPVHPELIIHEVVYTTSSAAETQ
jgi:hypothetical protein